MMPFMSHLTVVFHHACKLMRAMREAEWAAVTKRQPVTKAERIATKLWAAVRPAVGGKPMTVAECVSAHRVISGDQENPVELEVYWPVDPST